MHEQQNDHTVKANNQSAIAYPTFEELDSELIMTLEDAIASTFFGEALKPSESILCCKYSTHG